MPLLFYVPARISWNSQPGSVQTVSHPSQDQFALYYILFLDHDINFGS